MIRDRRTLQQAIREYWANNSLQIRMTCNFLNKQIFRGLQKGKKK